MCNGVRKTTMQGYLAMVWACLFFAVAGCSHESGAKENQVVSGLTAIIYNYSDEVIVSVRVDGELAGSGMEAVRPGGVTGGGHSCCIRMHSLKTVIPVEIKPALQDPYVVDGTVEHPWPRGATTLIVHLLPGRKVVLEATLGAHNWPRRDLLEAQLKELGLVKEVQYEGGMNNRRNAYDAYMEMPK